MLIQALQGSSLQITLVGYASAVGAPAYNEKLKMRRVKSVKAFLADVLRLDPSSISTEIAGEVADLKENNYLNRKVLVKYSEKLTTSK
ncbi:MAG: OmpA family protein [Owenweeksia sp.]|nr:OmpA family protein [Owenweeksia sp.]